MDQLVRETRDFLPCPAIGNSLVFERHVLAGCADGAHCFFPGLLHDNLLDRKRGHNCVDKAATHSLGGSLHGPQRYAPLEFRLLGLSYSSAGHAHTIGELGTRHTQGFANRPNSAFGGDTDVPGCGSGMVNDCLILLADHLLDTHS